MNTRQLGNNGPTVSALSLGCMGMSDLYGPADEAASIATIHAAIDAGMNLLDTGDFYGMGHNEMLIARALQERKRDDVVLSVKFGALRGPDYSWNGMDTRPQAIKNFVAYSLKRLNTDYIDIYRPARLDPNVPIEDTVGALAELVEKGYIRHIGLSEVGAETLRRAQAVHPIADLQIEYSLMSRNLEDEILPTCRELGVGLTAYGVLSRGLLSGHWTAARDVGQADFRAYQPRFQGDNLTHNLALVENLRAVADDMGVSVAQVAIAWVLSRGEDIVVLVGARSRQRLHESLAAANIALSDDDLQRIENAMPRDAVAGTRYAEFMMQTLDSER